MRTTLVYPNCHRCGNRFEAHRSTAKWCPRCKPIVVRWQRLQSYVNSWVTNTCEDCGEPFVATVIARWCPNCRPDHRRDAIVAGCQTYHAEKKATPDLVNDPWLFLLSRLVLSCKQDEDCGTCIVAEWCGHYSGYTEAVVVAETRTHATVWPRDDGKLRVGQRAEDAWNGGDGR